MKFQFVLSIPFTAVVLLAQPALQKTARPGLSPTTRALLNRITPQDLEGDLSFLASDALAGRFTPSPGLDAAAEFIASRFRAAGLEPAGDDAYFQTAHMVDRRLPKLASDLKLQLGMQPIDIPASEVQVYASTEAQNFDRLQAIVFHAPDTEALKGMDVAGKAVLCEQADFMKLPQDQMRAEYHKLVAFGHAVRSAGAVLELIATPSSLPAPHSRLLSADQAAKHDTPILIVSNATLLQAVKTATAAEVTVDIPAPEDKQVVGRNVVAVLRGSDPKLKDTYVLITAHYDHIGTVETAAGMTMPVKNPGPDKIYNGANDDGSGTVSVLEIARAFAKLTPHPKRSIAFMTFFGEERGEIGSEYFADHPIWPVNKIVADLNLEQVGRTDATDGKQVNTASLTGYDYSDITHFVEKAGALTGIKVYKNAQASDPYFTQSDNAPLAEKGIPAETLCVAFDYPDYHGLGDEWQKIDYQNMARVDRMVALALLNMANDPQPPAWNAQNPKTAPFREAQKH
ncbi:MAG TPA: M28 family peptidase [Bryobacteraceae bacterium]|nr:M28 family peptidase [Bryobacteraceae bacterium]